MIKILAEAGDDKIAKVYIAETENGELIEFTESLETGIPKSKKWILIISTLYGCPIKCSFCDSGVFYRGKISTEVMLKQIDFLIRKSFPDGNVQVEKFKIQFARMGEPSLNDNVLDVLQQFPSLYNAPGFIPSISTIAPKGRENFFDKLLNIKNELYRKNFQLQFSIHTTNIKDRDELLPVKKWSFEDIANYSEKFYNNGERKITLNFAVTNTTEIDIETLKKYFNPEIFFIKLTPVNPTFKAAENNYISYSYDEMRNFKFIEEIKLAGYDVLLSYGEEEENNIGSNCGQHLINYLKSNRKLSNSYIYQLNKLQLEY